VIDRGRRTRFPRVRVYWSLRTAHLERARVLAPASILYRARRYDFDEALAAGLDLIPGSTVAMATTLARSRVTELEVTEPLMRSGLPRCAAAIAVVRGAGWLRREPTRVVSYAIENLDPYGQARPASVKGRLRRRIDVILMGWVARRLDRVAFGTESAQELYRRRFGDAMRADSALIPALPSACECGSVGPRRARHVVFVGALTERKGIDLLVQAWPAVLLAEPDAELTIVGKGPLAALAESLAAEHDHVRLVVDPPRTQIHEILGTGTVLVLLSQRTPHWREQVGLPIVEALAHGLSVVTTSETGLASWLAAHGHHVLSSASVADVASAVTAAIRAPLAPAQVIASLPAQDGRIEADRWLFTPSQPPARR
jgi:hypothetical protein